MLCAPLKCTLIHSCLWRIRVLSVAQFWCLSHFNAPLYLVLASLPHSAVSARSCPAFSPLHSYGIRMLLISWNLIPHEYMTNLSRNSELDSERHMWLFSVLSVLFFIWSYLVVVLNVSGLSLARLLFMFCDKVLTSNHCGKSRGMTIGNAWIVIYSFNMISGLPIYVTI